ncbi:expressed unknown protein [Seminavis robusta]|uniref:Uncharacterized protein n=1 Tax=Seminavis robusta TaxID=568900 RepID=A0A9N8DGG8_9STRA|nr:expressed unknown protein [Seminavis robusta]|eukprot:Sro146_g067580.1 n/a (1093) ;mRNA; f:55798-59167
MDSLNSLCILTFFFKGHTNRTKPLIPPGLAMLMQFCADYTTINLKDMAQYYRSSEWNLRNLSKSIGTQQGSFSVFAPLQDGYGVFNIEVGVRISTLEWKRHLWDFLLHLTMEPAYTTDELYQLLEDAGGTMEVKMLSGFHTTFALDDEGELTIDGARLLKPYDMKGVDGYIHLVEQVPLPPSVLYTIYDQTQQNPDMTTVTRLIDTVQLGVFIDNLLPVTFFSAVNSAWDIIIPSLEIEDVLKNMMFELLWFDDYLADMDGQQITSVNGKKWNVQVFDDPDGEPLHYDPERSPVRIYISNADGPEGLTNCTFMYGPNRTNILARTGVIHHMDCLLLDYNYSKVDQEAPTFAPVQVTSSPSINAGKCVDDSCPCGEFFAEEWGTCVELTCWNWHIHKNDDTFALSDTNPCQDEFHFCGGDGSCHPFSCENWYRYGAGFSMDNSPDDLICGDYVTLIDDLHSVSFGCRPYLPGRMIPQRRNEVFFFNEECIAAADGQEFRCYQNKVGTNYDDFLREAARLQQDSCDREMYDVDLPQYWYTAVVAQGRDSGGSTTHQRTLSGPTFDGEKADMTMYAITVTVPSSTTPPPADPVGRCLRQFNAAERCVIESQCEDACNNILALTNANIGNAAQSNDGEPPSLGDLVDVFVDIFDSVCNQTKTSVCQMRECCAGSCVPQIDDSFDCMIDAARKDFELQLADLIPDVSQPSIECSVTDHVCPSEDEVPASSEDEVPASNGTSANETSPQQTPATPANATIVQVNTTFDVFNTRGLKAEDLLLPENRAILIQALTDFITNLVEQIEGQNQQTRLLRLRSRYLAAVLLPGSSRIVDIRDVECRADGTIPENATCQNVYGQYDLKVDDNDDKESVYNTYLQATDDAIEQGKLQESLAAASPSSPITVGGPIERESASAGGSETSIPVNMIQATQEEGEEDDGEKGAAWWVVLLSCLAGIFGCCVLGVAGLYVKKQRDQDADNAENDGVLEAPVKLAQEGEMAPLEGAPEEETNEDAPGSDSNDDESREESHSIQDNEVGEDEASSPLVAREAPHDAQPLLSDDPSAFIGADGNDQTSPLMAQPAPIRDQQSDSDDDDEEWE